LAAKLPPSCPGEALALAKLNHPNIETVFEFSTQDGKDFLAMELIPGSSLRERLKQGHLPAELYFAWVTQFVKGLVAAQEHGVVHRDLKSYGQRRVSVHVHQTSDTR
jgi:serine/threonine protein kinase